MQNIVLDTNILMEKPQIIKELLDNYNIILSIVTVEELDNLKVNQNADKAYKARQAIREIENNLDRIEIDVEYGIETKNDNIILNCGKRNNALIGTLDLNMKIKAKGLGIECFEFEDKEKELYKGYKEVVLDEYQMSTFYQCMCNDFNLLDNQYLIIKDENNEIVDKLKWTDIKGFVQISRKPLKSIMFGDIKAKDVYQEIAIDSLINDEFTLFAGKAGTAKTTLALAYLFQSLQNNKIDKIVIAYNPVNLNSSQALGFYPGDRNTKLMQTSLGGILTSKLGDSMIIESLISQGKLLILPVSDIRGVEISEKSALFVTEAQNTDSYIMKTIIQRCKQGCKIIIEGDYYSQIDMRNANGNKNGMKRIIDVFKGSKYFSCVELKNNYRSPIGDLAENL